MHPEPAFFGQNQQFGVEEPGVVCGVGEELPGDVGTDGLETALSIAEVRTQQGMQQDVVAAGDERPRVSPDYTRPGDSRVPIARSECPEMSGAIKGASAARSVERFTSM